MKSKLSRVVFAVNLVLITLLLVLNYFYQIRNFDYTLKCVCSSIFTMLGFVNLGYALHTKQSNRKFYVAMAAAIVFSMLGDVFIYFNFIAGAAAFAVSHIGFIVAYCFIQKLQKLDLLIGFAAFVPIAVFLLFCPVLEYGEAVLQGVCVLYAVIISTMFGKSAGNFIREKNILNGTLAAASFMFLISDIVLVFDLFSSVLPWAENACMALYYPSLCVFAFSMYIKACIVRNER